MHNDIKLAIAYDPGDAWGSTMGALFDIAEAMYLRDLTVPAELNFRPSPLLNRELEPLRRADSFVMDVVLSGFDAEELTEADLQHAARVLNRMADMLKAQGKDY
jgi:hypothetical protein